MTVHCCARASPSHRLCPSLKIDFHLPAGTGSRDANRRLRIERITIRWSFVVTVSEKRFIHQPLGLTRRTGIAALLLLGFVQFCWPRQTTDDWQPRVRNDVENQHLDAALAIVEQRLAVAPEDLEAHGWHGRLLAWKGRWSEGEANTDLSSINSQMIPRF